MLLGGGVEIMVPNAGMIMLRRQQKSLTTEAIRVASFKEGGNGNEASAASAASSPKVPPWKVLNPNCTVGATAMDIVSSASDRHSVCLKRHRSSSPKLHKLGAIPLAFEETTDDCLQPQMEKNDPQSLKLLPSSAPASGADWSVPHQGDHMSFNVGPVPNLLRSSNSSMGLVGGSGPSDVCNSPSSLFNENSPSFMSSLSGNSIPNTVNYNQPIMNRRLPKSPRLRRKHGFSRLKRRDAGQVMPTVGSANQIAERARSEMLYQITKICSQSEDFVFSSSASCAVSASSQGNDVLVRVKFH